MPWLPSIAEVHPTLHRKSRALKALLQKALELAGALNFIQICPASLPTTSNCWQRNQDNQGDQCPGGNGTAYHILYLLDGMGSISETIWLAVDHLVVYHWACKTITFFRFSASHSPATLESFSISCLHTLNIDDQFPWKLYTFIVVFVAFFCCKPCVVYDFWDWDSSAHKISKRNISREKPQKTDFTI